MSAFGDVLVLLGITWAAISIVCVMLGLANLLGDFQTPKDRAYGLGMLKAAPIWPFALIRAIVRAIRLTKVEMRAAGDE